MVDPVYIVIHYHACQIYTPTSSNKHICTTAAETYITEALSGGSLVVVVVVVWNYFCPAYPILIIHTFSFNHIRMFSFSHD